MFVGLRGRGGVGYYKSDGVSECTKCSVAFDIGYARTSSPASVTYFSMLPLALVLVSCILCILKYLKRGCANNEL